MPRAWFATLRCLGWLWLWSADDVAAAQPDARGQPLTLSCSDEPQLAQAAAELLLMGTLRPTAQQLSLAVRAAGSDAVGLHALFLPSGLPDAEQAKWLRSLRERVDGELTCGRADNEAGRLLIALGRGAVLEAIDARERLVRGSLRDGFHDAQLVLASNDGTLLRLGVSAEALRRGVQLPEELELPVTAQLVARGPSGPRPVAERSVTEGPSAERAPLPPAEGKGSDGEPDEASLSTLVLDLRALRGRGALRDNRLLREVASAHARDVCSGGRVAHELEPGSGPDTRLARAGLSARLIGETITRASDTGEAFAVLQKSPSHLFTLLDPRFTDFGVGVAQDQMHKQCYVVLLCAWPRYVGKR